MSNKLLKKIVIVFGFFFVVFSFYGYQTLFTSNFQIDKEDRVITIPPGTSFKDLREYLYSEKVLHEMISFAFVSKILKYQNCMG